MKYQAWELPDLKVAFAAALDEEESKAFAKELKAKLVWEVEAATEEEAALKFVEWVKKTYNFSPKVQRYPLQVREDN